MRLDYNSKSIQNPVVFFKKENFVCLYQILYFSLELLELC